jgi:hypothetical protein
MHSLHLLGPSSSFDRELSDWGNRRGGACFGGLCPLSDAEKSGLRHELHGAQVRLCMLPRARVYFKEPGNKLRHHEAYKTNVLVFVSGY